MPAAAVDPRTYRIFGLTIASDVPFVNCLAPGSGLPDIIFGRTEVVPAEVEWPAPTYASAVLTPERESWLSFYRLADRDLLRFAAIADFRLGAEHIFWCGEGQREVVETCFLGIVLACWLERAGVPCLHAAAIEASGAAVGFLSFNRGGKSSLAAHFVRAGHRLVTDDVLPVARPRDRFRALPAYPQMRLWPADAERFFGSAAFPRVHPGIEKVRVPLAASDFTADEQPLARLYLPERRDADDGPITIEPVRPRDAAIELVRHSFVGRLAEAAGWGARRFDLLARIAEAVPLARLSYPSGHEHLPRVREAVLADLRDPV